MAAKEKTIGFIGAGTVGKSLAILLERHGYRVVAAASRSLASSKEVASLIKGCKAHNNPQGVADACDVVFITTPDSAIEATVNSIRWNAGQYVVHCSGADSLDPLLSAKDQGAEIGVMHPLQSLATYQKAIDNLPGSTFSLEGDDSLLEFLKGVVEDLGGKWVALQPGDKVLYHAAAVIVSNYLVTLAKIGTDLWQAFGVDQDQALEALLPLIRGTVANLDEVGLPDALTGPIARGDAKTISKHLLALQAVAPELLGIYVEMGIRTIPIALEKGRISKLDSLELCELLQSYRRVVQSNETTEAVNALSSGRIFK